MASRINQLNNQLSQNKVSGVSKLTEKHPNDVVVIGAVRSAFGKGHKGSFKDTFAADILAGVFKGLIEKTGVDPKIVEDIAVGAVLAPGAGATEFRAAALVAGFPNSTSVNALNRQCSSGLQACVQIAHEIASGMIDAGIGAGAESMTRNYGPGAVSEFSDAFGDNEEAGDCLMPMGITSENVAKEFNISRADQDAFSAQSYQKAEKALAEGLFKDEIIPLTVTVIDKKSGDESQVTVSEDEGIRKGVTADGLAKIKPAFDADGTTTAGNASQVSDGAAAVLLMRRSVAEAKGYPIIGKYISASVVGVPPNIMGVGPAYAIPKVLEKAGISVDDVDIYELNEAFASQALMSIRHAKLPIDKINPKGGAIAFGHPLGCTGARQIATGLTELKRTGKKVLCTSMCVGTGMGMASLWVAE